MIRYVLIKWTINFDYYLVLTFDPLPKLLFKIILVSVINNIKLTYYEQY